MLGIAGSLQFSAKLHRDTASASSSEQAGTEFTGKATHLTLLAILTLTPLLHYSIVQKSTACHQSSVAVPFIPAQYALADAC
jgi:hypothetical protein